MFPKALVRLSRTTSSCPESSSLETLLHQAWASDLDFPRIRASTLKAWQMGPGWRVHVVLLFLLMRWIAEKGHVTDGTQKLMRLSQLENLKQLLVRTGAPTKRRAHARAQAQAVHFRTTALIRKS